MLGALRSPKADLPFFMAARNPPIVALSFSPPLLDMLFSETAAMRLGCSSPLDASSERYCARSGSMMLSL
jgi:hypothetical protein